MRVLIILAVLSAFEIGARTTSRAVAQERDVSPGAARSLAEVDLTQQDYGGSRNDQKKMTVPDQPIKEEISTKMIFGGNISKNSHVVGIKYSIGRKNFICSGMLISSREVLTAAHCACATPSSYRVTRYFDINKIKYDTGVRKIRIFNETDCRRPKAGEDLAILVLEQDLEKRSYTMLRNVSSGANLPIDDIDTLRVYGYGLTESGTSGQRREADIPLISLTCEYYKFTKMGCAPFSEMLLGERIGARSDPKDTCGGDSGGPVFLRTRDRAYLVGVTSRPARLFQPDTRYFCGGGGVYTTVARQSVMNWLFRPRTDP